MSRPKTINNRSIFSGLSRTAPVVTLPPNGIDMILVLRLIEYDLVDQAMQRSNGNKAMAGRLLGIQRTTLLEKLRARGIIEICKSRKTKFSEEIILANIRDHRRQRAEASK